MEAGRKFGLEPKIHVNQFTAINGIKACVENDALSVDHLEIVTDEDIEVLKTVKPFQWLYQVVLTFISIPYTPARK